MQRVIPIDNRQAGQQEVIPTQGTRRLVPTSNAFQARFVGATFDGDVVTGVQSASFYFNPVGEPAGIVEFMLFDESWPVVARIDHAFLNTRSAQTQKYNGNQPPDVPYGMLPDSGYNQIAMLMAEPEQQLITSEFSSELPIPRGRGIIGTTISAGVRVYGHVLAFRVRRPVEFPVYAFQSGAWVPVDYYDETSILAVGQAAVVTGECTYSDSMLDGGSTQVANPGTQAIVLNEKNYTQAMADAKNAFTVQVGDRFFRYVVVGIYRQNQNP